MSVFLHHFGYSGSWIFHSSFINHGTMIHGMRIRLSESHIHAQMCFFFGGGKVCQPLLLWTWHSHILESNWTWSRWKDGAGWIKIRVIPQELVFLSDLQEGILLCIFFKESYGVFTFYRNFDRVPIVFLFTP